MNIAIFSKNVNPEHEHLKKMLIEKLIKGNHKVSIHQNLISIIQHNKIGFQVFEKPEQLSKSVDLFISIGGDGTFLESVRYVRDTNIPIAGINLGRLGFLAYIAKNEIEYFVNCINNKTFETEKRSLLAFQSEYNPFSIFPYALNDITIQKSDATLITVTTLINGIELNKYWSDGLIISTPTGSTAYSMSAGGPIVSTDCKAFIISPIASHNLSVRPMVVPDNAIIELSIKSRSENFVATLDAQHSLMTASSVIKISKAPFCINIVRLPGHNFFATIRNKLMWGVDVRN
ncbi:MAG TPA: NAD kinase [Bacteroidales bacterium]|nr:NAD kinase [Bacteroidales bacterium]